MRILVAISILCTSLGFEFPGAHSSTTSSPFLDRLYSYVGDIAVDTPKNYIPLSNINNIPIDPEAVIDFPDAYNKKIPPLQAFGHLPSDSDSIRIYDDHFVKVTPLRAPAEVMPGSCETFIIQINNPRDQKVNLVSQTILPDGWSVLSGPDLITLEAAQTKTVVFVLKVNRRSAIGKTKLNFTFLDKERALVEEKIVFVSIAKIHDVKIGILDYPEYLLAGESFTCTYQIKNYGNCVENIQLSSKKGSLKPSDTNLKLEPGTAKRISVTQRADAAITSTTYVVSDLVAYIEKTGETIQNRKSIRAYPMENKATDPYFRFPLRTSVLYLGAKTNRPYSSSWQFMLEGHGHLDTKKKHYLDFTFRGPNQYNVARIGNYDQYTINYENETTRVMLGDNGYRLTRLTELARWGRGLNIEHDVGGYSMGILYSSPRFFPDINYVGSIYAKIPLPKEWNLQVSLMNKELESQGFSNLFSIRADHKSKYHFMNYELAYSGINRKQGIGASLEMSGRFNRFYYNLNGLYASKEFQGFYTNSIFTNSNISFRAGDLKLNAGIYYNNTNPALDTFYVAAPYSFNRNAGFSYEFSKITEFSVSYIYRFREDRFTPKKFAYREHAARFRFTNDWNHINLVLDGDYAQTENLLVPDDENISNSYNLRVQSLFRIGSRLEIGGYSQYLYTNRYSLENQEFLFYGGSLSLEFSNTFSMQVRYRNNYLIDEYYNNRSLWDVRVSGKWHKHSINIYGSYNIFRKTLNQKDAYVSATYSYSINPALSKVQNLASLEGQLISKDGDTLKNVVVSLGGQKIATDEKGQFAFRDVKPGTYHLHIDPTTLGFMQMVVGTHPRQIMLGPDENKNITLYVVQSGRIKGQVSWVEKTSGKDPSQMPNIIIKATNDGKSHLTTVREDGSFSFSELSPGKWQLTAVNNGWENEYQVVNGSEFVVVKGGESQTARFEIMKKEKRIQFKQKKFNIKLNK